MDHDSIQREFIQFLKSFTDYIFATFSKLGLNFEKIKDFIVDVLMVRRGANTSAFVHFSILGLAVVVLLGGGVFTSTSVVSGSFPGVAANPLVAGAAVENTGEGVISSSITPVTIISDKPRDKALDYEVKSGDTISTIAQEYGVSENTILWANNLSSNSQIKEGQKLKVLPVSGVSHKVASGDTIYSIAKKYQANSQAILDFPFNDVGDDFQLASGSVLMIPDGAPEQAPAQAPTQYLARKDTGPVESLGNGQFAWPASGLMAQFFSWYHQGIDISNTGGGPIRAADAGTVVVSGWESNGYGNTIVVDHGNGYTTRYAHLSSLYTSVGQKVGRGEALGMMGSTGRSTGTHLHFEIRASGSLKNPLSFLGK